jgi:hypothetical protein
LLHLQIRKTWCSETTIQIPCDFLFSHVYIIICPTVRMGYCSYDNSGSDNFIFACFTKPSLIADTSLHRKPNHAFTLWITIDWPCILRKNLTAIEKATIGKVIIIKWWNILILKQI